MDMAVEVKRKVVAGTATPPVVTGVGTVTSKIVPLTVPTTV